MRDQEQQPLTLDTPIVRSSDPLSSFEAAENVTRSGERARQLVAVRKAVQAHPGRTSRELAELMGVERATTGRRLPELRNELQVAHHPGKCPEGCCSSKCGDGKVFRRVCEIGHTRAMTWWPIEN